MLNLLPFRLTTRALSESLQTVVRPDKGSTVTISTEWPSCTVCKISGVNDTEKSCHTSLPLVPEEEVKLLFACSQPVDAAFNVSITGTIGKTESCETCACHPSRGPDRCEGTSIHPCVFGLNPECTKDACTPTTVEAQPSFLTEFPRTFTWELKAPEKTVVSLDILGEGLAESSQPCAGEMQYSVVHSEAGGGGGARYCKGGSVTRLDLVDRAVVTLQVQPKAPVSVLFQTSAGPLSKFSFGINQKIVFWM